MPVRRRRADPFVLLAVVLVALTVLLAVRRPWSGDLGMHAATVWRLRERPWHPTDPLVEADVATPYFSPYTLVLGLISRITGLSPLTVLFGAAPINIAVLLYGVHRLGRQLSAARWVPVLATVMMLGLWGSSTRVWSGFFSLWALPLVMTFPSTLALGLTLLAWAWALRLVGGRAARPSALAEFAALGLLVGVIALVHQFTFVTAALGLVAILLDQARGLNPIQWLGVGVAAVMLLLTVLAWPYYSFLDLLRVRNLDELHGPLYADPGRHYGYALLAVPALWWRWRRRPTDWLVLLCGLSVLVVVFGWWTGRYALGRVWPAVLLAAQLAAAVELAPVLQALWRNRFRPARGRQWWAAALAGVSAIGLVQQSGNLLFAVPGLELTPRVRSAAHMYLPWPDYSWIEGVVRPGDVVLTTDYFAVRTVPAYGAYTVAPAWPDPFLPDEGQRRADAALMVGPTTDAITRTTLLRFYRVSWMLDTPGRRYVAGLTPAATGPRGQRLYKVIA